MKLLIGEIKDETARRFLSERFETVTVPPLPVAEPIKKHVDTGLFASDGIYVCEPSVYGFYSGIIPRVICGKASVSEKYPRDTAYNAFSVCKTLVCKKDAADETLLSLFSNSVSVKQGYAKCSTVVVSENAVISSDRSICAACRKLGADVLFAGNEGVLLTGYDTGFLGGATAVTKDCVLFFGDIRTRKDCKEICDFISKHGKKVVYIPDTPLYDYGTPVILD